MISDVVVTALALVLFLPGCSTTVESTPEAAKAMESGAPPPPPVAGFFGLNASKLGPGSEGGAALAYINQGAQWSKYTRGDVNGGSVAAH